MYDGARLTAHLAHGRGKPTGAAVRDGRVQPCISRHQQCIQHHLFHNRVPDLDGTTRGDARLISQLDGRERGTVQAIAPGAATDHNHQIPCPGAARMSTGRGDPGTPAIDQRVGCIPGVKVDGPIHRGDPHLVAIILDAMDHAVIDTPRVKDATGKLLEWRIQRTKAQHVGIRNRPRTDSHDIAHHSTHAGVGPTKGLQCGRVIVRLHLEGQLVIAKGNDASVIHKSGTYPGSSNLAGGRLEVGLDQAVDLLGGGLPVDRFPVGHASTKGLVHAVFGPGLRQAFQFDIGGIAALLPKVSLNGTHLGQVQLKEPFSRKA